MTSEVELNGTDPNEDAFGFVVQADPKLVAEGWVRRHLVDPDRAQESIELYGSLGFEVRAEKLTPADFGSQCQGCVSIVCHSYLLIYTRVPGTSRHQ